MIYSLSGSLLIGDGSPNSSSIVHGENIDLRIGLLITEFEGTKVQYWFVS